MKYILIPFELHKDKYKNNILFLCVLFALTLENLVEIPFIVLILRTLLKK